MAVTPGAYDDEEEVVDAPLPAVSADVPVLTAEQLDALDPELREAYIAALVQELEESPLTAPQMRAHDLCSRVDELLYGGAAGGGKSHFAIWHADRLSRQYPGHRTLILRSSHPELQRTLIPKSHDMIDTKVEPGARWKAAVKEWEYGNRAIIEFGYCSAIDEVRQYLSAEYQLIIVDESTDMTGEMIEMLRSRLRQTKVMRDLGVNPHLLLLTNPGGPGHAWHRDRYVETTNHGEFVAELDERDERGRGRMRRVAYVPARVSDNPHIDPDYEANLVAIKDPVRRAQYLDGDWGVFEGQFFSEFRHEIHVVEPFEIKPEWGWPIVGGYDWGYASPACLLLGAVDQDRRIHIFREMYVERHTAADQARIFRRWGIKPDYICADPSIWRHTGVGLPISRQLMDAGMLPLRKAANERVDGWNRVREHLALDPDTGLPGLVIHSNCENLIRTLPDLPRDKNKPEDLDTKTEDHAADALRYLLMSRTRSAKSLLKRNKSYDQRVQEYVTRRTVANRRQVHDVLGTI